MLHAHIRYLWSSRSLLHHVRRPHRSSQSDPRLVDKIAREGHLGPVLEKKGILGETSGRRPGDVTIPLWCEGKGLAIDVAVTCPFSASNMARDNPAEYYAEKLKHRKYDAGFVGINFDFSALVFESTGGLNREGRETLSQLFRFAARFSGPLFRFCRPCLGETLLHAPGRRRSIGFEPIPRGSGGTSRVPLPPSSPFFSFVRGNPFR